jgi:hypothetical protein
MTWHKLRQTLGYQADMAKAAAAEREVCMQIARDAIARAGTIAGKQFADGYSFAAQEILAAIQSRVLPG